MHTAPKDDGYSRPVAEAETMFGAYVADQPDLYSGFVDDELMDQLHAAISSRGEETLTIYRAVPDGVDTIYGGDWVTLSLGYARQHAIQDDDPANDWGVLRAQVPGTQVFTDGNDLAECGYAGPEVRAERI